MENETDYFSTPNRQNVANSLQWQLSPDEILEEIEYRFKGYILNSKTGEWEDGTISGKSKRYMNDQGVNDFMAFFRANVGKFFLLTKLNDQEIDRTMYYTMCDVAEKLRTKSEDYHIDVKDWSFISTMIENNLYMMLKASEGGFRAIQTASTYSFNESNIRQNQLNDMEKQGLGRKIANFLGWKASG